jgi:enoyl-CoA hydratase/carnithine racemase
VPGAVFAYPALRNGVLPGKLDSDRLAALIGPGRSALLLLGGARIDSQEAMAWRLVDRLAGRAELERSVSDLSSTALHAEGGHLAAMKRLCRGGE